MKDKNTTYKIKVNVKNGKKKNKSKIIVQPQFSCPKSTQHRPFIC